MVILNQTPQICSKFSKPIPQDWSHVFVGKFFEGVGSETGLLSAFSLKKLGSVVQQSSAIHHAASAVGASVLIRSRWESRPDIRHKIKDYADHAYETACFLLHSHINTSERQPSNRTLICALILSFFEVRTSRKFIFGL